jgi:hypothetical protein
MKKLLQRIDTLAKSPTGTFRLAGTAIVTAIVSFALNIAKSDSVNSAAQAAAAEGVTYVARLCKEKFEARPNPDSTQEFVSVNVAKRPDFTKLSAQMQEAVLEVEEQLATNIEITGGSIRSESLEVTKFVQKALDEGKNECLEIRALNDIDLSGGFIGDSKRSPGSEKALQLPENLLLKRNQRALIFTTSKFGDIPTGALVIELGHKHGIWKGDPSEKDRVWIATKDKKVILDFKYRIPPASAEKT